MKSKILLVAAIAAFTLNTNAAPVAAQTVSVVSPIPAATRTNLATPLFIETPNQSNIGLQMDIKTAAAMSNFTYYFAPSIDGTTYDTNTLVEFVLLQASVGGTNTYVTNLNCAGLAGFYLVGVSNGHPTALVTNVLKYGVKKEFR